MMQAITDEIKELAQSYNVGRATISRLWGEPA
jgi:hypothetical protein